MPKNFEMIEPQNPHELPNPFPTIKSNTAESAVSHISDVEFNHESELDRAPESGVSNDFVSDISMAMGGIVSLNSIPVQEGNLD